MVLIRKIHDYDFGQSLYLLSHYSRRKLCHFNIYKNKNQYRTHYKNMQIAKIYTNEMKSLLREKKIAILHAKFPGPVINVKFFQLFLDYTYF